MRFVSCSEKGFKKHCSLRWIYGPATRLLPLPATNIYLSLGLGHPGVLVLLGGSWHREKQDTTSSLPWCLRATPSQLEAWGPTRERIPLSRSSLWSGTELESPPLTPFLRESCGLQKIPPICCHLQKWVTWEGRDTICPPWEGFRPQLDQSPHCTDGESESQRASVW